MENWFPGWKDLFPVFPDFPVLGALLPSAVFLMSTIDKDNTGLKASSSDILIVPCCDAGTLNNMWSGLAGRYKDENLFLYCSREYYHSLERSRRDECRMIPRYGKSNISPLRSFNLLLWSLKRDFQEICFTVPCGTGESYLNVSLTLLLLRRPKNSVYRWLEDSEPEPLNVNVFYRTLRSRIKAWSAALPLYLYRIAVNELVKEWEKLSDRLK